MREEYVVPSPPPSSPPFATANVLPVVTTRYSRAAESWSSRKLSFRRVAFSENWGIKRGRGLDGPVQSLSDANPVTP